MNDKELEALLKEPPKKMTPQELEDFLASLDVGDKVKEVF